MTRCPDCGATNAPSATWCGQCFASLEDPTAVQPSPQAAQRTGTDASGPEPTPTSGTASAAVRRTEEGMEWACVACETYNPMEVSVCRVCGTSFTARFRQDEEAPDVDWGAARMRSALLPGLGHVAAGRTAQGVGRAVLFGVWLLGGLLVVLGAGSRGLVIAAPLLVGALVVHLASLRDLRALERGGDEILAGRTLLWLVIGVTVALMVTTLLAITMARPA